jgi:hypothetical protein
MKGWIDLHSLSLLKLARAIGPEHFSELADAHG